MSTPAAEPRTEYRQQRSVVLSDSIWEKVRIAAIRERRNASAVVEEALAKFLAESSNGGDGE